MQRSISRSIRTLILTAAVAAPATLVASHAVADAYVHYEPGFLRQADRALRRSHPERALAIIEAHAETRLKSRQRAEAEGIACRAELALSNARRAKERCASAIELDNSRANWRFFNNLGVAELTLGNHAAAEEAFTRAATRSGLAATPRQNLLLLQRLRDGDSDAERVAGKLR